MVLHEEVGMQSDRKRWLQRTPATEEFSVELRFIRYADFVVGPKNLRR
jgi:hypothetical protein